MARAPLFSRFVSGVLLALCVAGCGGNEAPAQSPPPAPAPTTDAPSSPKAGASAPSGTDDAWEGEAEAKNGTQGGDGAQGGAETRTNEVIAKVIKDNRRPFRDCFEAAAKELPDLEGTMTIHFVLDPEGKVKSGELNGARSTIQAASIVNCAVNVLKQMKFPPSSRGMESVVNYPFDFKR
jgi:hypothetical protein